MRSFKAIGTLLVVSMLVLSHAGPAAAITGSKGGDVSTGKGKDGGTTGGTTGGGTTGGSKGGGTTGGGTTGGGTTTGGGGSSTGGGTTGGGGSTTGGGTTGGGGSTGGGGTTDPGPGGPSTTPTGGGERGVDRPSKGHANTFCEKPDPRVLSAQGSLVGHVFKVDCRDDGTTYYMVNLVPPFDSEARRVTFKSDVRPCACYPVRLKLNDQEVKKLIWMNAKH